MRGSALLCSAVALALVAPAAAAAQSPQTSTQTTDPTPTAAAPSSAGTGGLEYGVDPTAPPRVVVPGTKAVRLPNGFAAAPAEAPAAVQKAVFAANDIVGMPYRYGGGHNRTFKDSGYDCSGTVSYAFKGAGLLASPLDSGSFMSWGKRGKGKWITVYANPGHAYAVIAGLRLDTSAAGERVSSGKGPRWRSNARKQAGFVARHPKTF
jgi:cell wall-associated NlpC family hydrolase